MGKETSGINQILSICIGKELSLREYGYPENPKCPKEIYMVQDTLPEEARMKGDTLNMDELTKKHIGKMFSEILQQVSQDIYIDKGDLSLFSNLDSIFPEQSLKQKESMSITDFHGTTMIRQLFRPQEPFPLLILILMKRVKPGCFPSAREACSL